MGYHRLLNISILTQPLTGSQFLPRNGKDFSGRIGDPTGRNCDRSFSKHKTGSDCDRSFYL